MYTYLIFRKTAMCHVYARARRIDTRCNHQRRWLIELGLKLCVEHTARRRSRHVHISDVHVRVCVQKLKYGESGQKKKSCSYSF